MKEIALTIAASLFYLSLSSADDEVPSFQTHPIVREKELIITDLAVVDSPFATCP